jgi:hypothetical protein
MTWHADAAALTAYAAGHLDDVRASSIEAHTMTCGACRDALAAVADRERLDLAWTGIVERVDAPTASWFERALLRAGVSDSTARLIAASPSVRLPWITAVGLVLALTVLASYSEADDKALYAFLVTAPLLPLVGIALSFGRGDAARELVMSTPVRKLDLLLARALTVLLVTTAVSGLATAALGREDWHVVTWLLPALGLTAGALALSTWLPTEWAAAGLGTLWVSGALLSVRHSALHAELADRFVAFRPAGQGASLAVMAMALAVLALRRDSLEMERFA